MNLQLLLLWTCSFSCCELSLRGFLRCPAVPWGPRIKDGTQQLPNFSVAYKKFRTFWAFFFQQTELYTACIQCLQKYSLKGFQWETASFINITVSRTCFLCGWLLFFRTVFPHLIYGCNNTLQLGHLCKSASWGDFCEVHLYPLGLRRRVLTLEVISYQFKKNLFVVSKYKQLRSLWWWG